MPGSCHLWVSSCGMFPLLCLESFSFEMVAPGLLACGSLFKCPVVHPMQESRPILPQCPVYPHLSLLASEHLLLLQLTLLISSLSLSLALSFFKPGNGVLLDSTPRPECRRHWINTVKWPLLFFTLTLALWLVPKRGCEAVYRYTGNAKSKIVNKSGWRQGAGIDAHPS